jgi:hypothetical protein|tara:strand:+ start:31355 stop:31612 length:258 start_codon:yes stop_codon:yes gene_type:complete
MAFENRHYIIFDLSEVGTIDFSEVMETSADTLRKNVAGTQSFVKYDGAQPTSVAALTTKSQEYSHVEALSTLIGVEWIDPDADEV